MQKITATRIINKLNEYLNVRKAIPITHINATYVIQRDLYTPYGELELLKVSGKYGYEPITIFDKARIECKFYNGKWEYVIILSLNKNRCIYHCTTIEEIDVYEWIYNTAGKELEYYKGR